MIRLSRRAALAAFAAALVAMPFVATPSVAVAQSGTQDSAGADFRWVGAVAQGAWVRVNNINGSVFVEQGTGNQVEITATKRARRGDPEDVRIEVVRGGAGDGDVIVCALWNDRATCNERGSNNSYNSDDHGDNRGDVSVEFRVKLPAGVRVNANTVNGRVRVEGATSEVVVNTVNGAIDATSATGPVRASSVNGSIEVRMSQLGSGNLEYATVNGSMRIHLPASLNADVELSTVNGSLESDFPLTVQGRMDRRHMRARIGNGGPRLSFRTVNGSVSLIRS